MIIAKVCTIVVTYNAMDWAEKCFDSLKGSSLPTDIFVIDNGSTDHTLSFIRRRYPEITILENETNVGFGGANNQGLKLAYQNGYTHFFLLNQDAWIQENTLGKLCNALDHYDGFGVVSPIHMNGAGNTYDELFYEFVHKDIDAGFLDRHNDSEGFDIADIGFVNAAAWMISRECLGKVGLFHPLFFHYGEDYNYLQRVRYHGLNVGLVSNSFISHDREGRPPSKLKYDPYLRFKRDLLIRLLDPNLQTGWLDYFLFMYKRLNLAFKELTFRQFVDLFGYAVRNHRKIYFSEKKFSNKKLSIGSEEIK